MEYEIKSYKKKELDITNFWKKRGIDFRVWNNTWLTENWFTYEYENELNRFNQIFLK